MRQSLPLLLILAGCPSAYGPLDESAGDPGTSSTSSSSTCGDGVLQAPEECEDGNLDNTDSCTDTCQLAACGDSHVQGSEECDPGLGSGGSGACTDDCRQATCGDSKLWVDGGEECDDGINNSDAGVCTESCKTAICGDGLIWADGGEECDHAELNNDADLCTSLCKHTVCGDGLIQAGVETCDGEFNASGEVVDCRADCSYCQDGHVDGLSDEECDDAGISLDAECAVDCKFIRRTVFVTSNSFLGNLNGFSSGTEVCQSSAASAGLLNPGDFKAWLSYGVGSSPSDTMQLEYRGYYVRLDGEVIAQGWGDLVDGKINNPITINELGLVSSAQYAWTATSSGGTPVSYDCLDFSTNDNVTVGRVGEVAAVNGSWSDSTSNLECSNAAAIYCFEDPS